MAERLSMLNPHGKIIISSPDGPDFEADTHQCCHCGGHWVVQRGSGKKRGYCGKCNGLFCSPECAECVPLEKWLDIKAGEVNPTAVTVCGGLRLGNIGAIDAS